MAEQHPDLDDTRRDDTRRDDTQRDDTTPFTRGNRRDFMVRSGSAAAALTGLPALAATVTAPVPVFQHGVASGDPLADRVILWTRVTYAAPKASVVVGYAVYADAALTRLVNSGSTKTNALRDYTVKVDVPGLQPATTYYYVFKADGATSPVGRTKTLPVGPTPRLRMAVVSCSNYAYGYFNAYRRIAERADLDLVMHLGDYIYEYGSGQYGSARACEPPTEILTLADYRMRHAQHKRDADSQAMHRQHPFVAIWDDHETANNSWKDGAENHQPATEGDWGTRVTAALTAYYEWMPVRPVDTAHPRINSRSYRYGDLAEFLMLEERLNARSEQLPGNIPGNTTGYFVQAGDYLDPTRQMLGTPEETWLFDQLRTTPVTWKLVGQGVMFAQLKAQGAPNATGGGVYINSDQWDGYQPARDRVYAAIKGDASHPKVDNVVLLTGDIHSSWAADLTPDPNNPDLATGGYVPSTGAGALAVEFIGTSVTSPGVDDPSGQTAAFLRSQNPHFKYVELNKRGYMLVDVTPDRAVCEWWHLDTVAAVSNIETFAIAFSVAKGQNRLAAAVQTTPRANPPALAP